jgi:hypothetical protein
MQDDHHDEGPFASRINDRALTGELTTIILTKSFALALRFRGSRHRCVGRAGFDEEDRYAGIGKMRLKILRITGHQPFCRTTDLVCLRARLPATEPMTARDMPREFCQPWISTFEQVRGILAWPAVGGMADANDASPECVEQRSEWDYEQVDVQLNQTYGQIIQHLLSFLLQSSCGPTH